MLKDFSMPHGLALVGDASSDDFLRHAGIERARGLVAVMDSDANNLFTTMSARLLSPKLFIVARVEDLQSEQKLLRAGANRVVSPYQIGSARVAQAVLRPAVMDFIELATRTEHIELQLGETRVAEKCSLVGANLKESGLRESLKIIIVAIKKITGHMVSNTTEPSATTTWPYCCDRLGMGLILGYGGYEVTWSILTVGGLVAFSRYVFRLFAPVSIAIDLQSRLQRVGASIRRILEITNGDPQLAGRESTTSLRCDVKPELEFRSVWFCYNEDRSVLRDMSFRIEAGETVAVVGLNGSGNSNVGLLATRLYEPTAGLILVGGQDIRQVARRSLGATLTLVHRIRFFLMKRSGKIFFTGIRERPAKT